MSTIELNGKDFATQTSSAEPVLASTVTGGAGLSGMTSLGTVTTATLGSGVIFPSLHTPAFAVYLGANQTSLNQATYYKVAFNTEIFDSNSAYDATTDFDFTVPSGKAGYYFFHTCVHFHSWGGNNSSYDTYSVQLRVDNTSVAFADGYLKPDVQKGSRQLSHLVNLSVGEVVTVWAVAQQGTGSGSFGGGGDFATRFNGHYLGV